MSPLQALDDGRRAEMKIWFEFFADNRHWELEPFFDVDGGRAVALEDVEYIVYVEKAAGPVEVLVERHGYDVVWFNPANGETVQLKGLQRREICGRAAGPSARLGAAHFARRPQRRNAEIVQVRVAPHSACRMWR